MAFEPSDRLAILLKARDRQAVIQLVAPVSRLVQGRLHEFVRRVPRGGCHVFASVNPVLPGVSTRTRAAIAVVRHVFLDADRDGDTVLAQVTRRSDLPPPSYVLHSSPGRLHLFWRVVDFDHDTAERLQRQLARELGTDPAATPVTQMTRLPGFLNYKYSPPPLVTIEYQDVVRRFAPKDFPPVRVGRPECRPVSALMSPAHLKTVARARRYLAAVSPAVAGQHGDVRTFQVCCRLVRGFALSLDQAMLTLSDWNARCQPPWTESELVAKLRSAARNGREPVGGLL